MRPLFALALVCTLGCADERADALDARVIEGSVIDELDARGIGGATVTFVSDALDRAEVTSDGAGRFTLDLELTEGVRFGTLTASHADYARSTPRSVYFDGTALRVELELRPRD